MSKGGLPDSVQAIMMSGGRRITAAVRDEIRKEYKESSDRSRQAMVMAFHTYGVPDEFMAQILGVNPSEIGRRKQEALQNVTAEVNSIPEGPNLVAQIVVEGYSNLSLAVASVSQRAMDVLLTRIEGGDADPKDHLALQGYMKLMIESRNALTNRMERYGMLPLVPKNYVYGSVAGVQNQQAVDPIEDHMKVIAKKNGLDFDDLKRQIIEESVQ